MIVKDEEKTLARCLNSVKSVVDEIIIVDTGSSDKTKDIALTFTDKVYDFKWIDDFSAARNYSFSLASKDYLMWLDADDILPQSEIEKFLLLKQNPPKDINVFYLKYHIAFDQQGQPTFSYYRERIVKKAANPVWVDPIHEVIKFSGQYMLCDIAIEHRKIKQNVTGRNLKIFDSLIASGKQLSPRMQYYYARELAANGKTQKAIEIFTEFLRHGQGWSVNNIEAARELSQCYQKLGKLNDALKSAFMAFLYGVPTAEILCLIGELFLSIGKITQAAYWYKLATQCQIDSNNLGFVEKDYYDYIPYLQLCIIYYKLGDVQQARHYNDLAGKCKPNESKYLFNKIFFDKLDDNSAKNIIPS